MKRSWSAHRISLLSLCAAAALLGIAADHPHRTVPINGTVGTSFTLAPTETPGVFHNSIIGVGNVPRLGVCTVVIDETVDYRTDPPMGGQQWTMTFANGDQLTASLGGTGVTDETDPAFIKGSLQGSVTGGTGRFQNATGEVRGPFVAHVNTAPGVFPALGHGTIALKGWVRLRKN
jgi:hypothetical protein